MAKETNKAQLNIKHFKISDLKLAQYNPRSITEEEFDGLKESLDTYGLVENIVINKDMTVIGGHQRIRALQSQGFESVDCHIVDLSKKEEKKLNLLLNSHAISGKYDDLKLEEILTELKLEDDYYSLRLDKLEPLDLSLKEPEDDDLTQTSKHDRPNIKLSFKLVEDMENAKALIEEALEGYEYNISIAGGEL